MIEIDLHDHLGVSGISSQFYILVILLFDNYITKISSAPIPIAHPRYENGNNYTYDMSNII